jgi:hypothetical protein
MAPWRAKVQANSRPGGQPSYMAVCAIVKDQSEDLLEWIEWHRCGAGQGQWAVAGL